MTYNVFGLTMTSKWICDRYGLKESDIARCYEKADSDREVAAKLIETLITSTPETNLLKEINRRAGFRRKCIYRRDSAENRLRLQRKERQSKIEVETDYWEYQNPTQ